MSNILELYSEEQIYSVIEDESIDIDAEIEEESDDVPPNRKLYIDKVDKSTSDIIRMIMEGELKLQPEYQRKFVWNPKTMSQFVESLLLSIPIPTIFLAENEDDTLEVIDGQQRLTTVFAFYKSILSQEELSTSQISDPELLNMSPLRLSGLSTLSDFNKKEFSDLDERIQRKFKNVSLPIVIIQKDSSEDIKYDIFSRINQGSIKLNGQELLNVMYRGPLLKTLNEVCSLPEVDDVFGKRTVLKKRSGYSEVFLRALVFNELIDSVTWRLSSVPIKNVGNFSEKIERKYGGRLNLAITEFLKDYRYDENKAEEVRFFVLDTVEKVKLVFGLDAFKRINGKELATSINKTIAEVQLVTLSRLPMEIVENNSEVIKNSFYKFLETNDSELFIRGTNNTANVNSRYQWGKTLFEELGV